MPRRRRTPREAFTAAVAAVLAAAPSFAPPPARAQADQSAQAQEESPIVEEEGVADAALAEADAVEEEIPEELLLTEEELDDLVGPVALYPDALLAQVFVAATYPLDVVKADRWIDGAADLSAEDRAEAAAAEDWDASVVALAAGFPAVVNRMAEDLDWTEALGDALLTQSDDVLDAVQRQRARASALGNLETNAAQTVTVEEDAIAIEPTDPEVIYVPAYDSQAVYAQQVTAPPARSFDDSPEVVYVDRGNSGYSGGELLLTGALAFGAGMLVNEVFRDDDDWRGYWGPRYRPVHWNDRRFYPRPKYYNNRPNRVIRDNRVVVHGDVNINRRNSLRDRNRGSVDRDGAWRPDRRKRDEARRNVADRKAHQRRPNANRPNANRPGGDRPNANRPNANRPNANRANANRPNANRPGGGGGARDRDQLRSKLEARSGQNRGKAVNRPAAGDRKALQRKPQGGGSAFSGARDGKLHAAKKNKDRGAQSKAKAKRPKAQGRPAAQRPKAQGRPAAQRPAAKRAPTKQIKRPAPQKKAQAVKRPSGGRSAFGGAKRGGGGHQKAKARGGDRLKKR